MNTFTDRIVIEMFHVILFKGRKYNLYMVSIEGIIFDFFNIFSKCMRNLQIKVEEI